MQSLSSSAPWAQGSHPGTQRSAAPDPAPRRLRGLLPCTPNPPRPTHRRGQSRPLGRAGGAAGGRRGGSSRGWGSGWWRTPSGRAGQASSPSSSPRWRCTARESEGERGDAQTSCFRNPALARRAHGLEAHWPVLAPHAPSTSAERSGRPRARELAPISFQWTPARYHRLLCTSITAAAGHPRHPTLPPHRVEARGGLIQEQDAGVGDQRQPDVDALGLAA